MTESPKIPQDWGKTKNLLNRLGRKITLRNGVPHYEDRPLISRDSPVLGGVYLGEESREAIVVDAEKYPALKKLYETAKKRAAYRGEIKEWLVLKAVFNTVSEAMPPHPQNEEKVYELVKKLGVGEDKKVRLDSFIEQGIGICRHHALTCAALLELFKKDGHVSGKISVDRNTTPYGSHAWCRYELSDKNLPNRIVILDVTHKRRDLLSKLPKQLQQIYKRPED